MPQESLEYAVPDGLSAAALLARLRAEFSLRAQGEKKIKRVFYDTFDWRLHKRGAVLEMQQDKHGQKIYWRPHKRDRLKIQLAVRKVPALATELPVSKFRQQLQSVIGARELKACVKVKLNSHQYSIRDNSDKVVARIEFDECWYSPPKKGAGKLLCRRVTVKPVKGYPEDFLAVTGYLEESGLSVTRDNVMKQALAMKGETPGDYSRRVSLMFEPEISLWDASRLILLGLLEVMQVNSRGCIKGRDTEYLHDYRDAVLKSRFLMQRLEQSGLARFSEQHHELFDRLDELTLKVRQLDVFRQQLTAYQHDLKESRKQKLQVFCDFLYTMRKAAQASLVEHLKSPLLARSMSQWQEHLQQAADTAAAGASAKSALQWADETGWQIFEDSKKRGTVYVKSRKEEARRSLQQSLDQLNYLMEFFNCFYAALTLRELGQLVSELMSDLERLGELAAWSGIVAKYIGQASNEASIKECEALSDNLNKRGESVAGHFADIYPGYSSAATRKKFSDMFIEYHARQESEEDSDL